MLMPRCRAIEFDGGEIMIQLEELNVDNWLKATELEVSTEQKAFFPIPNVYWIGIVSFTIMKIFTNQLSLQQIRP